MEFKYTVYNPAKSKVANEILKSPTSLLIKRYIKNKSNVPTKFFDVIKEEVNKIDEEEYLINPFLWDMEGANLNHVANQLYVLASKVKKLGYEFKLDNITRDLDRLFGEYAGEVDRMTKETILPISKDITYFFTTEVLTNKIINTLESKLNGTLILD